MITLGNYTYIVYAAVVAFFVLLLYGLYLYWKRRAVAMLIREGRIRQSLVRGSGRIMRAREALVIISIILFAVVFLRPQWGEHVREVNSEGSDVLIALDVSRSMLAKDVEPSRLQKAKDAVRWLAESLQGDRIGLVLFAGDAFLQCPLTNDIGAFMMFLDAADPSAIRLQGTDIGKALMEAYRVFEQKRLTSRMLVLITDGEDHQGAADEAAETFRDLNVSVYSVGIGRDEGDIIPLEGDDASEDNYLRNSEGTLVRSKKNPDLLKRLAARTGGAYIDITRSFSDLRFILEVISDQQKNKYGTRIIKEKKDRFQIFVVILVLLLSLEIMLPERKPINDRTSLIKRIRSFRGAALVLAGLFFIAWLDPYRDLVTKGNESFHNKKYSEAKGYYNNAEKHAPSEQDKDRLSFNKADADYMTEDYDSALASFEKAVQSGDRDVQKKAFFNMGNVYLKQKKYREAVNAFINALKIDPGYEKAKKNLEYILKTNKQKQEDKSDKNKKGDEQQESKDKQQQQQKQQDKQKQAQKELSKEQIKNILREMKNKPVGRRKEKGDDTRNLDKNW